MISLPLQLPMIRIADQQVAACDPAWLRGTVRNAAREVNVPEWFADDVVQGVCLYLRNHYQSSVISIDQLFERICASLEKVGLSELSEELDWGPPPVRISLPSLAREAGTAYELRFFPLLADAFREQTLEKVETVHCYGLRKCAKHLAGARKWSRRCQTLEGEIRQFLDEEHTRAGERCPGITLSIT